MTAKKERWKAIEDKVLDEVWRAENHQSMIKMVSRNCREMHWLDDFCNHLLILDEMGNHLKDQVYQKLKRVAYDRKEHSTHKSYVFNALARLGNRAMSQEEYESLQEISEHNLVSYRLDVRLKPFSEKDTGNGPFYCHRFPREE